TTMKTATRYLIDFTSFLMIAISCNKDDGGSSSGNSDAKEITSFAFLETNNETLEKNVYGILNKEANTIAVNVPYGTNISGLLPTIKFSEGANYSPEGAQDFTGPVTY